MNVDYRSKSNAGEAKYLLKIKTKKKKTGVEHHSFFSIIRKSG